jgi:hypothetical protein
MFKTVALLTLPKQDLIRPPAALSVLAGICEQANVEYSIWDFNLWLRKNCNDQDWDAIDSNWSTIDSQHAGDRPWFVVFQTKLDEYTDQLIASKVDLICISVFSMWSAHCAWEMIHSIRSKSKIKILIGGTGIVTKFPLGYSLPMCETLLTQGLIDYYIHGEGEVNFLRLLQGDTNHPGINNLDSIQIDDLNSLPKSSYKKIRPQDYFFLGEPSLTINGSRGCVRACTYCDVAHYWPSFRFKDGISLANELYDAWKNTGVKSFEFSDSLINGSIREFRKLNKRLLELKEHDNNFDIRYKGQFICRDAKQFKEQDYKDMADAGCDYLYVGVETFSESVRMSMDKKFDNDALDFHLSMTAKYGIPNIFLMIVGYPTETLHDHELNLLALDKYQHYALAGVIEMITFGFTTGILDHTPLQNLKGELLIDDEFEDFVNDSNWVSLKNPSLTFKERVRRWVELTETADRLGYRQPRISSISRRLEQILELTKNKNRKIKIEIS